jgi:glycosyltransferase involved in cell wall biosynthesis
VPLLVVGEPFAREPGGEAYFRDQVLPQVDGRTVFYYGSANEVEKRELLRFARGLLFTTGMERPDWREPFGRVLMEALATGTPLIAHAHGSAPDVVVPEVGFLCANVDEMVDAVRRVHLIDRRACRRYARLALSRERMGRDCEALFREVIMQRHGARSGQRLAAAG